MDTATALKRAASKAGLTAVEVSPGHWHIKGGAVLVNYYPDSRSQTAYIAGMVRGHKRVSPEQAVQLALKPEGDQTRVSRRRKNAGRKRRMFRKSNLCWVCGKPIEHMADATVDHRIPLSRGGLDNSNNIALAHEACNSGRGNNMPTLKEQHGTCNGG